MLYCIPLVLREMPDVVSAVEQRCLPLPAVLRSANFLPFDTSTVECPCMLLQLSVCPSADSLQRARDVRARLRHRLRPAPAGPETHPPRLHRERLPRQHAVPLRPPAVPLCGPSASAVAQVARPISPLRVHRAVDIALQLLLSD